MDLGWKHVFLWSLVSGLVYSCWVEVYPRVKPSDYACLAEHLILMILGVRLRVFGSSFLLFDRFLMVMVNHGCRMDSWPTTLVGRVVSLAHLELAETMEVSGGTHTSCGEVLTRVRLGKPTRTPTWLMLFSCNNCELFVLLLFLMIVFGTRLLLWYYFSAVYIGSNWILVMVLILWSCCRLVSDWGPIVRRSLDWRR